MAGQNVIRDSDDEDSDDPTAANPPLPTVPISSTEIGKVDVESSAPKQLRHSGEPSTGSTELLSREIEDACKRLLEPTPDAVRSTAKPRSSTRQLSSSPAVSRLKSRRATTNFAEPREKKPLITYSRASQDDSAHFRSSGSGAECTPRRSAHLATDFQGVQEQDTSPQAQEGQPQCTPTKASVHASFPELTDHVPSTAMLGRTPSTGQNPTVLEQDSAEFNKRLSPQINQPEPYFQKPNEPTLNDSFLSPEKFSRREDHNPVNFFQDELSISIPMPAPSNARSKLSKLTRFQQNDGGLPADSPGSDELIDGLPAEQYKPRPSRSRSGHGDVDLLIPVDFSKRPEITAKRKKKRRKTTAFERPVHDSEDDREIIQTRNPVVIIETRSNLKSASEAVETNPMPKARKDHLPEVQVPELGSKSASSKKRGRPRKEVPESAEELDASNNETGNLPGLPEPNFSDEGSSSKILGKKRRVSPEPPPRNGSDSESYDKDIEPKTGSGKRITILKELKDNSNLHLPSPSLSTKCTTGTLEHPSPTTASIPPQTPQKVKGPDKHSPIASSKVAYRVGLSKRARIEPLLRIVRK